MLEVCPSNKRSNEHCNNKNTIKQQTKTDDKVSWSLNAKIIDCVLHGGTAVCMHTGYNITFPQFLALISLFELYEMWNIRTKAATTATATAKTIKAYSRQRKTNKIKCGTRKPKRKKNSSVIREKLMAATKWKAASA